MPARFLNAKCSGTESGARLSGDVDAMAGALG
jgi:hypothetical protein